MPDKKITVYGAEWCAFCHMVMHYLDDKKISYDYKDVDKNHEDGINAIKISGQRGIPVTDIDGDIIIGFDRAKIDESLAKHHLVK